MSRRPRHPEAVAIAVRARAAATTEEIGRVEGWRFSFGWLVTMKRADGAATRHDADSYEDAIKLRAELLRTDPALVVGWVIQKGPPERPDRPKGWQPRDRDDDLHEATEPRDD